MTTLTWTQARRIALRAQGMGPARRTSVPSRRSSRAALERTLGHTHLLQIDSVSVFARAHHLPVFTRAGTWDPAVLDDASRPGPARLVREAIAHEAAYATEHVHRLLDFRRRSAAERDRAAMRKAEDAPGHLLGRILTTLSEHGPASAATTSRHLGDHERGEGWGWRRTATQWAVDYLFRAGALDSVGRNERFERLYVPVEHAAAMTHDAASGRSLRPGPDLPPEMRTALPPHEEAAAVHGLVALAARSLGVSDPASLADYFRLRQGQVRPAIAELLATGDLTETEVAYPGGTRTMLLHRDAPQPAPLRSAALISPFDPIVFHRPRLAQLFDVDYRIGIYTPAARRTRGYYSLLFLHGDLIPARVDLKADRPRGILEVRGTFREELPRLGRRRPADDAVARALAGELSRAARWQGLERVEVLTGPGRGELAPALEAQVRDRQAAAGPGADPAGTGAADTDP